MDSANTTGPTLGFQTLRRLALRVWAGNPRRTVRIESLDELATSIASVGVLEPLLARPLAVPDGEITHEILAGQRRFLAAGIAQLAELPVIVREVPDDVALELALAENAGREDVHPLEEAEAIDALVKAHGRTAEQVADRLGRPVRWVQRRLALLSLCPAARALLVAGTLPLAHAQALAAVDVDTQVRVLTRFPIERGFPTAKTFAREITYELHLLSGAPFDAADEKLPGGRCNACPKRSDRQIDLFCDGPSDGAHCLDAACWEAKVAAIWERAQKAAKKKHLQVLNGDDVFWGGFGPAPQVRADAPYTLKAPAADAKPVAIARTSRGKVVELYAAPAVRGGADDEAEGETEDERHEKARARDDAHRATMEARRAEAQKIAAAKIARLVEVAGTSNGLALALRVGLAGLAYLDGDRGEGLFRVCNAMGLSSSPMLGIEGVLRTVGAEDLPLLAAAYLASAWALDPDADDQDPAARELRALLDAPPARPDFVDAERINGLGAGDRITLEGDEVEVLSVDAEGFVWRTLLGPLAREEGEVEWSAVEHVEGRIWRVRRADAPQEPGTSPDGSEARGLIELRVKRGDWLQHRSGLRDTAKAPLHKRWLPEDQDRVAMVERGELYGKILAYCREHSVTLFADRAQVSPEKPVEAPASPAKKPAKGKKGGAP